MRFRILPFVLLLLLVGSAILPLGTKPTTTSGLNFNVCEMWQPVTLLEMFVFLGLITTLIAAFVFGIFGKAAPKLFNSAGLVCLTIFAIHKWPTLVECYDLPSQIYLVSVGAIIGAIFIQQFQRRISPPTSRVRRYRHQKSGY